MRRTYIGTNILAVAVVFGLGLFLSIPNANAQGTRRKRVPPASTNSVPGQPQTVPLIISRAEDFPDTETQPLVTTQVPKTDDSVQAGDGSEKTIEDLKNRVKSLEAAKKPDQDEKQKRLLMNLDILSKAEQRTESLRKQVFEMIERESAIKTKLDTIAVDIRPEAIERSVAFAGTLRPEELRDMRKKTLEVERTNLQALLTEVQRTKSNLELNLQKAEMLVDKLRSKVEKEIDAALVDDPDKL